MSLPETMDLVALTVHELQTEGGALIDAHSTEAGVSALGPIDLDFDLLTNLEDLGSLVAVGLRSNADGVLRGYAFSVVTPSLLHRDKHQCQLLGLFIQPAFRRGLDAVGALLDTVELVAKAKQASHVFWSAPKGGALEAVLGRRRNTLELETLFVKEL